MECDVLIAGGGPSGSVAGLVLSRLGYRCLLLDEKKSLKENRQIGESLIGAARPLLRHLELLETVEQDAHSPCYGNLISWGSSQLDTVDFIFDPHGLGWHLNRCRFDKSLKNSAEKSGVKVLANRILELEKTKRYWLIKTKENSIKAKWVIDATGRASHLARLLGIKKKTDHPLQAVYGWVKSRKQDTDSRTLVEAVPEGWWYTSLLKDGTRALAFHCLPASAGILLKSKKQWEANLSQTTYVKQSVGTAKLVGGLNCVQASGAALEKFGNVSVDDSGLSVGWLATGDAALSFDPLSSQGIFNALYTGMKAGETVDRQLRGESGALSDYQTSLNLIRQNYLSQYFNIYRSEYRWREFPFWKIRSVLEN